MEDRPMGETSDPHLLQCVVPAVTVPPESLSGMEQRAVPAEVEALEAALRSIEKAVDLLRIAKSDDNWYATAQIGVSLHGVLESERRRASTGGND